MPDREILYLTPGAAESPVEDIGTNKEDWPIAATNPPIMIPGIDADGSLFPIEKIEAHIRGIHHLAVSVFVFCDDQLLIQRRAVNKYHCGGMWANTCCTHPHFGEDVVQTANRRLMEELGLAASIEERLIVEYSADVGGGLWERERVHMFRADVLKGEIELKLNPDEVADAKWVSGSELKKNMADNPTQYTPWFRIYMKRYPDLDF